MTSVVYLILDTNILLHFVPLEQIDWPALCQANEVRIVLYPRLLTEISNAKDMNPRKHLRDRAGKRERWLRDRRRSAEPIRPAVYFEADPEEHRHLFAELGLDRSVADDSIVVQAVAQTRRGRHVCVATADFGLEMKLEHQGVRVVCPSDRFKLAAEPDPERLRADRAEQRLRELQERLPCFQADLRPNRLVRKSSDPETDQEFVQRMFVSLEERVRAQASRGMGFGSQPPFSIAQLNSAERSTLEHFLRQFNRWYQKVDGTMPVSIGLGNNGGAVATNVRVSVSTDEAFLHAYISRDIRQSPARPAMSQLAGWLNLEGTPSFPVDSTYFGIEPYPIRLRDRSIGWNLDRLQHQDVASLQNLCLQPVLDAAPQGVSLRIEVLCDELPTAQEITLPVELATS